MHLGADAVAHAVGEAAVARAVPRLRQHGARRLVHAPAGRPGTQGREGGLLGGLHRVPRARELLGGLTRVHPGARVVALVAVQGSARVDQHDRARLHLGRLVAAVRIRGGRADQGEVPDALQTHAVLGPGDHLGQLDPRGPILDALRDQADRALGQLVRAPQEGDLVGVLGGAQVLHQAVRREDLVPADELVHRSHEAVPHIGLDPQAIRAVGAQPRGQLFQFV